MALQSCSFPGKGYLLTCTNFNRSLQSNGLQVNMWQGPSSVLLQCKPLLLSGAKGELFLSLLRSSHSKLVIKKPPPTNSLQINCYKKKRNTHKMSASAIFVELGHIALLYFSTRESPEMSTHLIHKIARQQSYPNRIHIEKHSFLARCSMIPKCMFAWHEWAKRLMVLLYFQLIKLKSPLVLFVESHS